MEKSEQMIKVKRLVEVKSWLAVGLKVALEYAWESEKRASTTTDIPKRR